MRWIIEAEDWDEMLNGNFSIEEQLFDITTVGDLVRASNDRQLARMRLFGARFCNVEKCEANTFNCEKCALTFLRQDVDPFLLEMKGFLSKGELERLQRQIEQIDRSVDIVEHDDGSFESVFGGIEAVNNKVNIVDTWRR